MLLSASIDDQVILILLMRCITLIDLPMLNHPCIPNSLYEASIKLIPLMEGLHKQVTLQSMNLDMKSLNKILATEFVSMLKGSQNISNIFLITVKNMRGVIDSEA